MDPQEEQKSVEQAQTDDSAFSNLYEHYLPKIYGYIHKRIGNKQIAEDLTSQTFLKAFENFSGFSGGSFKGWIYRIATNTVIDFYRTHKPVESIEFHEDMPSQSPSPQDQAVEQNLRASVFIALRLLPEKYQRVLHLKFFADLRNDEMALSLGITENNLGVLLYRALKQFQKVYNNTKSHV